MTYREQNFSGDRWKTIAPTDGSEFIDCNFSQIHIGTVIFTGFDSLSFRSCNLKNVAINPEWVIDDCNTCQAEPEPEVQADPNQDIQNTVNQMLEFATTRTSETSSILKATASKEQTQGLLSADGAPVILETPNGWRAE